MEVLLSPPVQAMIIINVLSCLALLFPFVTGVWSLGLPGFMCLGAYVSSWLSVNGTDMAVALALGATAGGLLSLPFGLLALRVKGIYLSIATLAGAELVTLFFSHFKPTGEISGFTGMAYIDLQAMWVVFAICVFLSVWLYRSRLGKALIAVGSDPTVAACNGISVPRMQLIALGISGVLGGLAGGLFAHYYSFISPLSFSFEKTTSILLFLVAGGMTPLGAVAGPTILTLIPQYITGFDSWAPAMYGVIVICTVILTPKGLFPKNRLRSVIGAFRRREASSAGAIDQAETRK